MDAYGLPRHDRSRVVDAVVHTHDWGYDIVREAVAGGHESFGRVWREGGRLRADRTREWIAAQGPQMRAVLAASIEGRGPWGS